MNKNNTTKPKTVAKKGSTCTEFCKCKQENTWACSLQSKQKLSKPVINSSHRQLHCMEQLSKLKLNSVPDNENAPVASSSKVTQRLNFGTSHKVFKNLTPINVNDSLLLPKEKVHIPKKYVRSKQKIPEPDLRDFIEPLEPFNYFIPEPEIKLDFPAYEFDVMSYVHRFVDN